MVQKHRIATNLGQDQKITVELKQDYDLLEILSLKFTQKEIYTSLCSDYGVVVGRISANNGLGIPNAKISIFIPLSDDDVEDPVISALYPYKLLGDRDQNNYRYNLLPSRKQHGGHTPTGTFPDQSDILNREEVLEVYEKYYNYTVKTNSSGDFMIWGVPIGNQTIHVDVDLSDMGCFSLRPFDFIRKGVGESQFDRFYNFKSSTDIDGLPQIVTFEKTIEVYPFWGNTELCEIGITRTDFDLSDQGIKIEPVSLILASAVTDENSHAIKRNGKIRRNTGYKCNLQTSEGTVDCVRFTGAQVNSRDESKTYPELEYFELTETIDQEGSAMIVLPMNLDYVYTNEFGEQVITNDSTKGVPTTSISRFRFSLTFSNRKVSAANYLVPNIREFNPNTDTGVNNKYEYYENMVSSYMFSDVFEDYITPSLPSGTTTLNSLNYTSTEKSHKEDLLRSSQDYFYKFVYGKVYTVSSFQGTHYETARRDAFLGIKEIRPNTENDCASKTNYFPVNFGFKNRIKIQLLLAQILLFLQFILAIILNFVFELLGRFFYTIGRALYNIYFGWPFRWRPFAKIGEQFQDIAFRLQVNGTQTLSLTTYPDCEECTTDDEAAATSASLANLYCSIGEIKLKVIGVGEGSGKVRLIPVEFNTSTTDGSSNVTPGQKARDYDPSDEFMSGNTFALTGATKSATRTILNSLHTYTITPTSGDINDARFIFEGVPLVDDSILPYSVPLSGDSENITKSISISEILVNFSTNTALGDIGKFETLSVTFSQLGNPNTYEWKTDGKYGTKLEDWINYVGTYNGAGDSTVEAISYSQGTWGEISGFNYEGYSGGQNGEGNFADRGTYVIIRIYDRSKLRYDPTAAPDVAINIEEGCQKYDKAYNETISQNYLWSTGNTYGDPYIPIDPDDGYPPGFEESTVSPGANYTIMADIIGVSSALRLPRLYVWSKLGNTYYDRKTKSGYSEIRDGVFLVIPVIRGTSKNTKMIQEWYRRKRIGLFFCGGVINYSFIDNWLNGMLYFFKFDKRIRWDDENSLDLNQRGSKFPRELIFYNIFDKEFYYRSTPYNATTQKFIGQSYYDDGNVQILHPTTFYDVGVRDEFFKEICTDPSVDPTCSVIRDIGATSYQDPANIVEYNIEYRLDTANGDINVDDFFDNNGYTTKMKVLDGDMLQMFSINSEAGIEAFDLDSPHYFMYQGEYMDPESTTYKSYFTSGGTYYGPLSIDFKLDNNGEFMRSCLNYRLGDFSQTVPFYLWDKSGNGFGPYNGLFDKQLWDRTKIASGKLQRLYSVSSYSATTTNYNFNDGEEEYLLMPMTITHNTFSLTGNTGVDSLERFDIITSGSTPSTTVNAASAYTEGNLWLVVTSGTTKDPSSGNIYVVVNKTWVQQTGSTYVKDYRENFVYQTQQNYSGTKQVLSTPFLFYFGLTPQKTALDKFIKYFGPKGAFTSS